MPPPDDLNWEFDVYTEELTIAAAKLDEMPLQASLGTQAIRNVISHFPKQQRTTAFAFLQGIQNRVSLRKHALDLETMQADKREEREHGRELRGFWAGLALLVVVLVASAVIHTKDLSTTIILRVMAGLGVGLTIAFMPGFFSLNASVNRPTVRVIFRSTGAFAALVMVYLFDPGWFSSILHWGK